MIKKLVIILALIGVGLCILIAIIRFSSPEAPIAFLDYSYTLSDEIDTLELSYINWACACPNWFPKNKYDSLDPNGSNCIFIEAAHDSIILPEKYQIGSNNIQVIGSFYKSEGISRDYIKPTSEKPKKARVFQYKKIKLIRPYSLYEVINDSIITKPVTDTTKLSFE